MWQETLCIMSNCHSDIIMYRVYRVLNNNVIFYTFQIHDSYLATITNSMCMTVCDGLGCVCSHPVGADTLNIIITKIQDPIISHRNDTRHCFCGDFQVIILISYNNFWFLYEGWILGIHVSFLLPFYNMINDFKCAKWIDEYISAEWPIYVSEDVLWFCEKFYSLKSWFCRDLNDKIGRHISISFASN